MCSISPKLRTFTTMAKQLPLPDLPSTQLMDLPNELLLSILDTCTMQDSINFISTCKRIRSLRTSLLKQSIISFKSERFINKENLAASPSPERIPFFQATPFKVVNTSPNMTVKRARSPEQSPITTHAMASSSTATTFLVSPISIHTPTKRVQELQSTPAARQSKKRLRRL